MISPSPYTSCDEDARLATLQEYDLLDTQAEASFDHLVAAAAGAFDVPIAMISLVDCDRQWFKARQGLDVTETPRDVSFCSHAIRQSEPLVVPDAPRDPRFASSALVTGQPNLRFYAGVPLRNRQGHALGTLCVAGRHAREARPIEIRLLQHLGSLAMELIEQRRLVRRLRLEEVERVKMTVALRLSDSRLDTATRAGRIGTWDWDLRSDRVQWSRIHLELWDLEPATFQGTLADFESRIHPEDRAGLWAAARAAIDGHTEYEHEYRLVRPNGRTRWILGRGRAEYDESGTAVRMTGVVVDVTEKVESRRQLTHLLAETEAARRATAASEQRYRLLFECHPSPLWVYDLETLRFLAVNEAAVRHYGWSREEFLTMTIKDIRPAAELPALLDKIAEMNNRPGVEKVGEWIHQRKDGTQLRVEVSSHGLLFDNRKARLVLACDITEKRSLQDQFLRAQRMENLGMLAAGIAHDLNNILTPMMMIAPLLGRRLTTESDQRLLLTVEQSVRRGAGLVKQITSFAKGSGNELGAVQVKHLARDVAAIIEETFPRSIHFNPDIASDLWVACANPTQVHQVLLNLCVNARDAMPDGGELTLRVINRAIDALAAASIPDGRPGNFVVIEVSDTGTGIAPEVVDRIWDPFFTTKEEGKGTGLGLATVRGIVSRHHGFITLDTEVGRGSTFRVYLPSDEDGGPGEGSRPETCADGSADAKTASGAGECILYVDDEADIRTFAHAALSQHGYRPLLARDAEQALALFQEHRDEIRLVITDHHMPGMYGDDLIVALSPPSRPSRAALLRQQRPALARDRRAGDAPEAVRASHAPGRRWPAAAELRHSLQPQ